MQRTLFDDTHQAFRDSFRTFLAREAVPHRDEWEAAGIVDRSLFRAAGANGFLGIDVPEEFGGGGVKDFRFNLVIAEEIQHADVNAAGLGLTLHNDVCLPYFLHLTNDEQKQRWLPGICAGELITAVAMTEPGIGSDLASMTTTAMRDGDDYIVNGSKTFITNGINADLVITAVKTDPSQRHRGMSLLVIERDMPGFERGRNLEKVGMHAQDTAELFFADARVPVANRLGDEGTGFLQLVTNLPQERLSIAVDGGRRGAERVRPDARLRQGAHGVRPADRARSRTAASCLAEMATEIEIGQSFVDRCVLALNAGELTADEAAMAKWWCTELQGRVADLCVQLHGGYGYMTEYPIARAFADARITRIYGGTTEIMKEIIGRSLGV